jgi:phage terminase large subunit
LFDGGSRAGKTFCILMFFIFMCLKFDYIRFLAARLNFNHVVSSIWLQDFPKILPNFKGLYHQDHSHHILSFPLRKSEIWLGGLDTHERTEKVFGQEYAGIFLNEAVQLSPSTIDKVETRLAQKIKGFRNIMIYDCNPRHPEHHLYQKFYINKKSNQYQLSWTPYDNLENLPDDYINRLKSKDKQHRDRFEKGLWTSIPGAVYENIKAENIIETVKDYQFYEDITIGIDFGLYSAITVWGIKHEHAFCIYEFIRQGASNVKTSNIINCLDKIWWIKKYMYPIYCDHEPDRIEEIYDAGYNAKKANKEIGAGDSTVNSYELWFDKKACNTFQSMLNLVHAQDKNDVFIYDKHVKENDHEADASRYALHSHKSDNSSDNNYFINKRII